MTRKPENYHLIPDQAFLFFPSGADLIKGQGIDTKRAIFQGDIAFTPFQSKQLAKLEEALNKQRIVLPDFWSQGHKLRFLQANQYNIKKTISEMIEHTQFHNETLNLKLSPQVERLLKAGVIYFCGRDNKYRPISVFDAKKIVDMKVKETQFYEVMKYYTLFMIKHALIQGQIQNMLCIVDVGFSNIFNMATRMKNGIMCLSKHFKARNFKTLVLNCPSSINFVWAIAKNFLNEDQKSKINFIKDNDLEVIMRHANKDQIQQKFGGNRPNIKNFWPPTVYSNNFSIKDSDVKLIKVSTYQKMYLNNQLKGRKINKNFIDKIMQLDEGKSQISPIRDIEHIQEKQSTNKHTVLTTQFQKEELKKTKKVLRQYNDQLCKICESFMKYDIQIDQPLSF